MYESFNYRKKNLQREEKHEMVPKDHGAQKETSTQDLNFRAMSKVREKGCCLVVCSNILIR